MVRLSPVTMPSHSGHVILPELLLPGQRHRSRLAFSILAWAVDTNRAEGAESKADSGPFPPPSRELGRWSRFLWTRLNSNQVYLGIM